MAPYKALGEIYPAVYSRNYVKVRLQKGALWRSSPNTQFSVWLTSFLLDGCQFQAYSLSQINLPYIAAVTPRVGEECILSGSFSCWAVAWVKGSLMKPVQCFVPAYLYRYYTSVHLLYRLQLLYSVQLLSLCLRGVWFQNCVCQCKTTAETNKQTNKVVCFLVELLKWPF